MKNIDLVNKIVAKRLEVNEDIVTKVNKFYWKKVKKKLSTLDSTAVCVKGFATFSASRYNVRNLISETIAKIRATKISNKFKESTKEIHIARLYDRLRNLLRIRNELAKIYNNEHYIGIRETSTVSDEEC